VARAHNGLCIRRGRLSAPARKITMTFRLRTRQRHNAGCPAFEVLILCPFHPRAGQMVRVEHGKRFAGEDHLVVVQPDGTLALIPAWMSEDIASSASLTASPRLAVGRFVEQRARIDALIASQGGTWHSTHVLSHATRFSYFCASPYDENRKAATEDVIEADPVAARVREMMAKATTWIGSASDLLRVSADFSADRHATKGSGWPKSPRALAGRLRRAQTSLRALGIDITFTREGRAGTRMIRMNASDRHPTPETVSTVSDEGPSKSGDTAPRPGPVRQVREWC
jgi:hypothetical protein